MQRILRLILLITAAVIATPSLLSAQEPKLPADLKKVAVADGVELHYIDKGKGVPIIFIHGGTGDYTTFEPYLGPFAENYRAITYSRPYNFPNTNKFQPKYSYEIEADYLATLMKKLGLEKAHIVGHSNGGLVALCLAIKHPERVRTLILGEPPVNFKGDPVPEDVARRHKTIRELFEQGKPEEALKTSIEGASGGKVKWDQLPEAARKNNLRNARAFEAMPRGPWNWPAGSPWSG